MVLQVGVLVVDNERVGGRRWLWIGGAAGEGDRDSWRLFG